MSNHAKATCYNLMVEFGATIKELNVIKRVFEQAYFIGHEDGTVTSVYGMSLFQLRKVRDFYIEQKGELP